MRLLKFAFSFIWLLTSALTWAQQTYTQEIGQFQRLKIDANVNIVYKNLPDSTGMARYVAPPGCDKLFILTLKGNGTLRVQLGMTQWEDKIPPTLYLYSSFLNSVESSSDLTVIVENPAPCATFNANQTGNGSIIVEDIKCTNLSASLTTGNGTVNISGSCTNANFRMVGTGTIYADRLQAENVNCKILGTGSIGCWAIDNLTVKGLGTTKIYYKGHPNIKKTGGGKLFDLPESMVEDYDKSAVPVTSFDNPVVNENEVEEDAENDSPEDEENLDEEEEEDDDYDPDDENYQTVVTKDD